MMEPFERIDIQELPLSVPSFRRKVEDFLGSNGLRLEEVDLYLAVLDDDDRILAGGGLSRDLIKCIAVSEQAQSGQGRAGSSPSRPSGIIVRFFFEIIILKRNFANNL